MLIEKAWAKLHGSYCMIRKGSSISAMPHLTGAPSVQIDHNFVEDVEQFWQIIIDADEKNFVVTCANCETDFSESVKTTKRRTGVVSSHSYSLLSVHAFKSGREQVRLLKLRDPWGTSIWDGDWSTNSPKWTEKIKQELGVQEKEAEGIFFIAV